METQTHSTTSVGSGLLRRRRSVIKLKKTRTADLDFIYKVEHDESNSQFITPWKRGQHESLLDCADTFHSIITDDRDQPVGFVFVKGMAREDGILELKRIVVTTKGRGLGRAAIREIKRLAFGEWGAQRLWLDVRDFNDAAKHLYEAEGFLFEGKGMVTC